MSEGKGSFGKSHSSDLWIINSLLITASLLSLGWAITQNKWPVAALGIFLLLEVAYYNWMIKKNQSE